MWQTPAPPERSDEELMLDCRRGGDGGSRLFARYREPVWRFFRRRVHDAAVAEELAQDVFAALLTAAPRYEPRAPFRSYLFGIAYNLLMADRRKRNGKGHEENLARRGAPPRELVESAPLLARTARLSLVPRDFDEARAAMERIITTAGGFTGSIALSDPRRGERSLTAMLRVPSAKLDEVLISLRQLGHVTEEAQDGEDVTQQSVDLDARLSNARASEKRLQGILANRTGRLSDVLDVEREISRVREEIERMEASRQSLDRRITYAVVNLQIAEERKAAVDLGPLPVSTRLRNAIVDGCTGAISSALGLALFLATAGPSLVLWGIILGLPAWLVRRRFAD